MRIIFTNFEFISVDYYDLQHIRMVGHVDRSSVVSYMPVLYCRLVFSMLVKYSLNDTF